MKKLTIMAVLAVFLLSLTGAGLNAKEKKKKATASKPKVEERREYDQFRRIGAGLPASSTWTRNEQKQGRELEAIRRASEGTLFWVKDLATGKWKKEAIF